MAEARTNKGSATPVNLVLEVRRYQSAKNLTEGGSHSGIPETDDETGDHGTRRVPNFKLKAGLGFTEGEYHPVAPPRLQTTSNEPMPARSAQ